MLFRSNYSEYEHINCGSGEEVSIRELAETISSVIGYNGELVFDTTKPDGTPRKLMDSTKIRNLGWVPKITLANGVKMSYDWYLNNAIKE